MGGHAVVIHGWGVEAGAGPNGEDVEYWVGRNSWSQNWGDEGTFKFVAGINAKGIEGSIYYVHADNPEHVDASVHGECVKVQRGPTADSCVLVNTCQQDVRAVKYNHIGTHADCGSWASQVSLSTYNFE